jgi:hypothetical protein
MPTPNDLARPDPKANACPGQELVYESIQRLWGGWARWRFREEFDRVRAFCLFVGYPRSGHSVVGAMLNAHRDAVISHELDAPRLVLAGCDRDQLYARILARAAWFNLRGNRSNYRYQIPNRWQGRFETLRVLGDKGGGWVAQWLRIHPDLLDRVHATTGVPLRLIHVVRNPFDNIAAISQWHRLSLEESIEFYFAHCETTASLVGREEVVTMRHEDFIESPEATLTSLCEFLGLTADDQYLSEATSIVFARPTGSRRKIQWPEALRNAVERRAESYPFLSGYDPALNDDVPGEADRAVVARNVRGPTSLERLGAWLRPRVR